MMTRNQLQHGPGSKTSHHCAVSRQVQLLAKGHTRHIDGDIHKPRFPARLVRIRACQPRDRYADVGSDDLPRAERHLVCRLA